MAKKKKKNLRAKKVDKIVNEQSVFWPLALAVLLFVVALLLLLGGFNTGGPLPKDLFHGAYWTLGRAAYLAPIALVLAGVYKFTSEDKKLPITKLISLLALLVFSSSFLFTAVAVKHKGTFIGGRGGNVGKTIGVGVLHVLDKFPASLIFLALALLAAAFAFGVSGKTFEKLRELFNKEKEEDGELAALKQKSTFQLNEGVPVEHHSTGAQTHLSSFKNTAQKLATPENHQALTLASDPDWKFPGLDLLNRNQDKADAGDVEGNAKIIRETLQNFNIDVEMEGANVGPRRLPQAE